jgi:hypothetical protein
VQRTGQGHTNNPYIGIVDVDGVVSIRRSTSRSPNGRFGPGSEKRAMSKKSKNKKKHQSELDRNAQQSGAIDQSKIDKKDYEAEIFKLQVELVKIQDWVKTTNARIVIIFEETRRGR